MKFEQKYFPYHTTRFEFGEHKLEYSIEHEKSNLELSVHYQDIKPKKSYITLLQKWPLYMAVTVMLCIAPMLFSPQLGNMRTPIWFMYCVALVGGRRAVNDSFRKTAIKLNTSTGGDCYHTG